MTLPNKEKAVILLSGGLDSATILALAINKGFEVLPLTFLYGQKHNWEIGSAKKLVRFHNLKNHKIIKIDLSSIGGSALTDKIDVPKNRNLDEMEEGIPITYVPARNTIFLSIALGYAEVENTHTIFIGVNAIDYSGYPDCRPEFIQSFETTANLATKMGVEGNGRIKIHTPLIDMGKSKIIKTGIELGVDYSLTHSCYDPNSDGNPCGECDACILRLKGFEEAGLKDPLIYNNEL